MSVEAMKQALEALENCTTWNLTRAQFDKNVTVITSLSQAIDQYEKQDPVAWMSNESAHRLKHGGNSKGAVPVHAKRSNTSKIPLYNAPPTTQCGWIGMTDEELKPLCDVNHIIFGAYTVDFVRSIEAKLKEKNT